MTADAACDLVTDAPDAPDAPDGAAPAVRARLEAWRAAVDGCLARIAAGLDGDAPAAAAVRYALAGGGKRIRPILCLAAADVVAPATARSAAPRMRAAAAIEMIHTYSLVHDDLPCMDDDDLRRGRPTVHRAFGTRAAVLAGLALIPAAVRVLDDACADLDLERDARTRAVTELCRGAGAAGMVGGQLLDLEAEGHAPALPGLERVHAMKTGALFRAAASIGATMAGGGAAAIAAAGDFAARLGLAFQVTDDVLDVTMDAQALGKTPGKDEDSHKGTFVSLLGLQGARERAAAEADAAVAGLRSAGLHSPVLEALAGFAVNRDR